MDKTPIRATTRLRARRQSSRQDCDRYNPALSRNGSPSLHSRTTTSEMSLPFKASSILLLLTAGVTAQLGLPAKQLDPTAFAPILKYASYVEASYQQPCKKPPGGAVTIKDFNITSSDTQASLYRLDSSKELIIAYPGSNSTVDYITDLTFVPLPYTTSKNCSLCLVHAGFANAFNSIMPPLESALETAVKAYPSYTITVTGGSLGGALAKLTFNYFKDTKDFGAKVTAGWSFGEPRVGNKPFADYSDSLNGASETNVGLYRRVTHANDLVPQIPPVAAGFWHSRTEIWEMNNQTTGVPDAGTIYRCFGQEPVDCVNGQGSVSVEAHLTYAGADIPVCN
ncbi:hypothetical protein AMS68_002706 [Peltaster fructicola]|uniref:Fungal lipase-type domain-containing protein n=1 Tax=Peltaster fructicola TaxID=286661 RepID=A0A6H0XRD5_9PEZI|nr:hypothetical protein AMS68_002706 [Peltaster fructicola]